MLRCAVWLVYLLMWTLALVTSPPTLASEATLPAMARFPVAKVLHVAAYCLTVQRYEVLTKGS